MRSAHESKEKLLVGLFLGGFGCVAGGFLIAIFGLVLLGIFAWIVAPVMIVAGLGMLIAALVIGLRHNSKQSGGGPARQEEARVVARFAINDIGEMIFDNYDYDAPGARFYCRVQYLSGKRDEFECARPIFDQCGEGMRGLLTTQGNWLSQFTQLIDTDETRAAYREF